MYQSPEQPGAGGGNGGGSGCVVHEGQLSEAARMRVCVDQFAVNKRLVDASTISQEQQH